MNLSPSYFKALDIYECHSSFKADILFKKYGGLPRMKYDSLCARCVYNQAKRVQFDEKLSRDKHKINNAVKTNYT